MLLRVLIIGILLSLGSNCYSKNDIDSSFIGTYIIINNYYEKDTLGYLKIKPKTYSFVWYKKPYDVNCDSSVYFLCQPNGIYSIESYTNLKQNKISCIINLNPLNNNQTYYEILQSSFTLRSYNNIWSMKYNMSRSFPRYNIIKVE